MDLTPVERRIREVLIERARKGTREEALLTYRELGLEWGPNNDQQATTPGSRQPFRGLGRALGNILRFEHEAGRPLLTSIVVQEGTRRPGSGFTELVRELGPAIPEDEHAWWSAEVDRVLEYWSSGAPRDQEYDLPQASPKAASAARRNPPWALEEIILALDVYLQHGVLDASHPRVKELSEDLNALDVHPYRPDVVRWRNANAAALKLSNFAHFDPGYPGKGLAGGSRLDRKVFEQLSPYPDLVSGLADRVRAGERIALEALPVLESREARAGSPEPSSPATATFGSIERQHKSGKFVIRRSIEQVEVQRAEQPLVLRFCEFVGAAGYEYGRFRYTLDGVDYLCDLVLPEVELLVEAKSKLDRSHLRMAVGQVKDYDFMQAKTVGRGFDCLAVLLRGSPPPSAIQYLEREGIGAIWPVHDGWSATSEVATLLSRCDWSTN